MSELLFVFVGFYTRISNLLSFFVGDEYQTFVKVIITVFVLLGAVVFIGAAIGRMRESGKPWAYILARFTLFFIAFTLSIALLSQCIPEDFARLYHVQHELGGI